MQVKSKALTIEFLQILMISGSLENLYPTFLKEPKTTGFTLKLGIYLIPKKNLRYTIFHHYATNAHI